MDTSNQNLETVPSGQTEQAGELEVSLEVATPTDSQVEVQGKPEFGSSPKHGRFTTVSNAAILVNSQDGIQPPSTSTGTNLPMPGSRNPDTIDTGDWKLWTPEVASLLLSLAALMGM